MPAAAAGWGSGVPVTSRRAVQDRIQKRAAAVLVSGALSTNPRKWCSTDHSAKGTERWGQPGDSHSLEWCDLRTKFRAQCHC